MSEHSAARRLSDLLRGPQEDLGVEGKTWLDLKGDPDHKAVLAKALLALANHGGGFVLIGFDDLEAGLVPSTPPPSTLDCYSQDVVNGIVQAFADPPFHCGVSHIAAPSGDIHPIITVPGGHKVPIRAKKGGPNNATVIMNAIYIRRPGPKSETPQSGQEWDSLLARCLANRKDEMLEGFRTILSGSAAFEGQKTAEPALDGWTQRCRARWEELIAPLPPDDGRRCPRGRVSFAFGLEGDLERLTVSELEEILARRTLRYSGWPPWRVPRKVSTEPYFKDDTLECWLGRDGDGARDAAHSDFWRVSPEGRGFLLRGYQEDGPEVARRAVEPGAAIDLTLPIWRTGEALLAVADIATRLGGGDATMIFRARYEGLAGRKLMSLSGQLWDVAGGVAHDDTVELASTPSVASVSSNLPEIILSLLAPLYERFGLFRLNMDLVREQLAKMRSNRA